MPVVVDANVIFSALVAKGKPLTIFILNRVVKLVEFVTPEYLFSEIGKKLDKLLEASKLSKEELSRVFSLLKEEIRIVPTESFIDKLEEAKLVAPHPEDAPYFALALKLDCPILSGEKRFKLQSRVKVYSPTEFLETFFFRR